MKASTVSFLICALDIIGCLCAIAVNMPVWWIAFVAFIAGALLVTGIEQWQEERKELKRRLGVGL